MEYLIKSSAIVMIFYVFYKIFLEKETFFQSIRIYLQIGLIASLAIPLIEITKYKTVKAFSITADMISQNAGIPAESSGLNWEQILTVLYFTGVVFFTIRFLLQLGSVLRFISKHKPVKVQEYRLIDTDKNIAPFSFFNVIVINRSHYSESEIGQILKHEKAHASQMHSIDILMSQLLSIVLWFNPFVWLYNIEIQKNLEFIADEKAQYFSKEKKNYQYLLLKIISPEFQLAFTNNFYNSLIKKRIDMLLKNRSSNKMQFKFTLIIPVLIAFIFVFNTKVIAQKKSPSTVIVGTDYYGDMIIKKDTKNSELDEIKNRLAENSTTFKYRKLKRNSNGEITGIEISIKSKTGNQSKISQSSSVPIKPIQIKVDGKTGAVNIGNVDLHESHQEMHSTSANGKQSTFIVKNNGNSKVTVISNGSDKKGNNTTTTVWVSDDGNTTILNDKKLIKTGGPSNKNIFIIESDDLINASNDSEAKKLVVFSTFGENPLFYKDGKKITEKEMKDINPDTIESINVLKGKMAVKKYGEKGKNGVVEITTKK